jgi:parvulin-like peptidyl-prolyl isomerase
MKTIRHATVVALVAFGLLAPAPAIHAEIVEEVVAWVNGEIITLSEYEEEEQGRIAEIYRRFTGEELDAAVEQARKELLLNMIDRRIMVHRARALGYDIDKMADAFLEQFMAQQKIDNPEDLKRLAEADGMTVNQVRSRLVEMYAPDEVIRMEVTNRVSVSDGEIETFYAENREMFAVEGEVTLREIVLLADTPEAQAELRAKAEEIRQKALSGELFASLAREHSESGTAENGGEFGPLKRSDLSEILEEPAFSLPIGTVSDVMETPYGFHIIKVDSRVDAHSQPLEELRERIRNYLREEKFRTELAAFLKTARDDSEWCVKPKHEQLLSIPPPPPCDRL